jgi:hypothetical protein
VAAARAARPAPECPAVTQPASRVPSGGGTARSRPRPWRRSGWRRFRSIGFTRSSAASSSTTISLSPKRREQQAQRHGADILYLLAPQQFPDITVRQPCNLVQIVAAHVDLVRSIAERLVQIVVAADGRQLPHCAPRCSSPNGQTAASWCLCGVYLADNATRTLRTPRTFHALGPNTGPNGPKIEPSTRAGAQPRKSQAPRRADHAGGRSRRGDGAISTRPRFDEYRHCRVTGGDASSHIDRSRARDADNLISRHLPSPIGCRPLGSNAHAPEAAAIFLAVVVDAIAGFELFGKPFL